jgi:hypothetical protein
MVKNQNVAEFGSKPRKRALNGFISLLEAGL